MRRVSIKVVALVGVLAVLAATLLVRGGSAETRTVTAHFPRAVSVYVGTDVRILGVNVGEVTEVSPEGESVRVEMEYDAQYDVPADAQAVVVTPTLVADRFVQLTPVYTAGAKMADGADIALPETGVPVELDRIYAALRDLTHTLGPNGVNADGTLDNLLEAGAQGLDGQGQRANDMIRNLAAAATTFGQGSGDLFETVSQLAEFTSTLATNDKLVQAFMKDLAGVSDQLAAERQELEAALASVADAVGTVETFVRGNRKALAKDVRGLTRVVRTINSEKGNLDDALRIAPVAIGNLVLAFNSESGTIGSRIGFEGNVADADGFLCAVVQQSELPSASKALACTIFEALLEQITSQVPTRAPGAKGGAARQPIPPLEPAANPDPTLDHLIGGTP
jgi:phospholipid/cholesterol/gamma-HCH transport system substrate-binding protein